jgi:hypothetical protein
MMGRVIASAAKRSGSGAMLALDFFASLAVTLSSIAFT